MLSASLNKTFPSFLPLLIVYVHVDDRDYTTTTTTTTTTTNNNNNNNNNTTTSNNNDCFYFSENIEKEKKNEWRMDSKKTIIIKCYIIWQHTCFMNFILL